MGHITLSASNIEGIIVLANAIGVGNAEVIRCYPWIAQHVITTCGHSNSASSAKINVANG